MKTTRGECPCRFGVATSPEWVTTIVEAYQGAERPSSGSSVEREKMHFLNAVPIRLIHDRWIDKFTERQVSALVDLKTTLDKKNGFR